MSARKSYSLIISGVTLALAYKVSKVYITNGLGVAPEDYFLYQTWATIFRALNSVLAFTLCWLLLKDRKNAFLACDRKIAAGLLVYLSLFFLLKIFYSGVPNLYPRTFMFELFFNGFTGISEEFIFRGLIFIGMYRLWGFAGAGILSSILFSAWHYDVNDAGIEFVFIFLTGFVYAYAFASGVGLVYLAIVHFFWDQITFGWHWGLDRYDNIYLPLSLLQCFAILMMFMLRKYEPKNPPVTTGG